MADIKSSGVKCWDSSYPNEGGVRWVVFTGENRSEDDFEELWAMAIEKGFLSHEKRPHVPGAFFANLPFIRVGKYRTLITQFFGYDI